MLAGAVSASQPEAHVDFFVYNLDGSVSRPATKRTALNDTTDVVILAAPTTQGEVREVFKVSIYNKDSATITVTVKTDDATTERIIVKQTITTLKTLCWEKSTGWYVI